VITKHFIQTSEGPPETRLVEMIDRHLPTGWTYEHFDRHERLAFVKKHFPQLERRYHTYPGVHQTDMFRYMYLYRYGGFYMDTDAMLYTDIERVIGDHSFVSVESVVPGVIFAGVLGAKKESPILGWMLGHLDDILGSDLRKDYFLLCRALYAAVMGHTNVSRKLYHEIVTEDVSYVVTSDLELLFKHYYRDKVIPDAVDVGDISIPFEVHPPG
jgi:hypothetical protein